MEVYACEVCNVEHDVMRMRIPGKRELQPVVLCRAHDSKLDPSRIKIKKPEDFNIPSRVNSKP